MKANPILKIILLSFFINGILVPVWAQKNYSIVDPKAKYGGLTLIQTDRGSGLGLFFEYSRQNADRLTLQANFLMIKGSNDYPLYDPYTGYIWERSDKRRLTLCPLYLGYKKVLFADKIANNFRPFFEISLGPVIAFDPPNIPDFSDRIKRMRLFYAPGFQVSGGADFFYGPGTTISLYFGYDFIKFAHKIDRPEAYNYPEGYDTSKLYQGQQKFNGIVIKIGFGKRY